MPRYDSDGYDENGIHKDGHDRSGRRVREPSDPLRYLTVDDWDWITRQQRLAATAPKQSY